MVAINRFTNINVYCNTLWGQPSQSLVWPDLPKTHSVNHAIKNRPTVVNLDLD